MSIHRRVRGQRTRYEVRWREDGRQRGRTFDRRSDAETWEREVRRRRQLGAHTASEPTRQELGGWLTQWWERDSDAWYRSTQLNRAVILDKWVVPFIGGVRLRDLGSARVREWRAEIVRAGASHKRANAALGVLSAALGAAVEDGLLPANPCSRVRRLPQGDPRRRALTPLEVERVRAAMPTARDALLVSVLAYAGLRPGEAVALTWGSVGRVIIVDRTFTEGELKDRTKSRRRRTVEVVPPLSLEFEALRPSEDHRHRLVFAGTKGQPIDWRNWVHRTWRSASRAAGVDAVPYECRHTYASLLIHEGRSLPYVAAALGHSSATTTLDHYAHVFDEARLAPMDPMVEAIEAARAEIANGDVRPMFAEEANGVLRLTFDES